MKKVFVLLILLYTIPVFSQTATPLWYQPYAFTPVAGSVDSGDVADLRTDNATRLVIQETGSTPVPGTTTPGSDFVYIWTGVTNYNSLVSINGYYDGSAGHYYEVQFFNWNDRSWYDCNDTLHDIALETEDQDYEFEAPVPRSAYISGNDEMRVRIYLPFNGSTAHYLRLDQMILVTMTPTDTPTLTPTPTNTQTSTPTGASTYTPTNTPTPSLTPTPTNTPTDSPCKVWRYNSDRYQVPFGPYKIENIQRGFNRHWTNSRAITECSTEHPSLWGNMFYGVEQASAPDTPPSGYFVIYGKDDQTYHLLDDLGTDFTIMGTGGDHGGLGGLGDQVDHAWALTIDGTRGLSGHWDAGAFNITAADIRADGNTYTNYDGPDGTSYHYWHEGSSPTGVYLAWDNFLNQHLFSGSLKVNSSLSAGTISTNANYIMSNTNLRAKEDVYAYYGSALDWDSYYYNFENASSTGAYVMWDDSESFHRSSHSFAFNGNNLYQNWDGADGDQYHYWYDGSSPTGQYDMWDDSPGEFVHSGPRHFLGSITSDGTISDGTASLVGGAISGINSFNGSATNILGSEMETLTDTSNADALHDHTGASLSNIDIGDDTNLTEGPGIDVTGDIVSLDISSLDSRAVSPGDWFGYSDADGAAGDHDKATFATIESTLSHDALANFVAAEHYDWTSESHDFSTSGSGTFGDAVDFETATLAAAGPTDNYDVTGINVLFLNCMMNNVTIGGFVGGIDGQVLCIAISNTGMMTSAILEYGEAHGNQKIYLNGSADQTITSTFGGWVLACNGTNWYEVGP